MISLSRLISFEVALENQQIINYIKCIKYHSHRKHFFQPINFNKVRLIKGKTCIGYLINNCIFRTISNSLNTKPHIVKHDRIA